MGMKLVTDRATEMRALLLRNERGEATLRELAAEAGVHPSTLSWWRRELKKTDATKTAVSFVELKVPAPAKSPALEVRFEDFRISVPAGFDASHLADVMRALREC